MESQNVDPNDSSSVDKNNLMLSLSVRSCICVLAEAALLSHFLWGRPPQARTRHLSRTQRVWMTWWEDVGEDETRCFKMPSHTDVLSVTQSRWRWEAVHIIYYLHTDGSLIRENLKKCEWRYNECRWIYCIWGTWGWFIVWWVGKTKGS